MNIGNYASYFHDGSINAIKNYNNIMEIWMESCEILPDWKEVDIPLSRDRTIAGKLILLGIKQIFAGDNSIEKLELVYDDGEILNFSICNDTIELLIVWCNFPPKERTRKFEQINIQSDQIEWENIPDLFERER